eukprot:Lankesteria_metandrocarpae@DN4733_c0_g1_i2.p1
MTYKTFGSLDPSLRRTVFFVNSSDDAKEAATESTERVAVAVAHEIDPIWIKIYYVVSVFTFGLFTLFTSWFPIWRFKLLYRRCPAQLAQKFLLENVRRDTVSNKIQRTYGIADAQHAEVSTSATGIIRKDLSCDGRRSIVRSRGSSLRTPAIPTDVFVVEDADVPICGLCGSYKKESRPLALYEAFKEQKILLSRERGYDSGSKRLSTLPPLTPSMTAMLSSDAYYRARSSGTSTLPNLPTAGVHQDVVGEKKNSIKTISHNSVYRQSRGKYSDNHRDSRRDSGSAQSNMSTTTTASTSSPYPANSAGGGQIAEYGHRYSRSSFSNNGIARDLDSNNERRESSCHKCGFPLKAKKHVIIFEFRCRRYILEADHGCFVQQEYGTNFDIDLIHSLGRGISDPNVVEGRRQLYGPCMAALPAASPLSLLKSELLHPTHIFQIVGIVFWLYDRYYVYAIAIAIVTVVSVALDLVETLRRQRTLSSLSQQEQSVMVVRRTCEDVVSQPAAFDCAHEFAVASMNPMNSTHTVTPNSSCWVVKSSELVPGHVIRLEPNVDVPCDAILLSGQVVVNESMLTGESMSVSKTPLPPSIPGRKAVQFDFDTHYSSVLLAGSRVGVAKPSEATGAPAQALVIRTGFSTLYGSMMRLILYPPPCRLAIARDSLRFVAVLFGVSILGMIATVMLAWDKGLSTHETVIRCIDLVFVAIPPALPTSVAVGMTIAASRLLSLWDVWCLAPSRVDAAGFVNTVVFDKTGTLTERDLCMEGLIGVNDVKLQKRGRQRLDPFGRRQSLNEGLTVNDELRYSTAVPILRSDSCPHYDVKKPDQHPGQIGRQDSATESPFFSDGSFGAGNNDSTSTVGDIIEGATATQSSALPITPPLSLKSQPRHRGHNMQRSFTGDSSQQSSQRQMGGTGTLSSRGRGGLSLVESLRSAPLATPVDELARALVPMSPTSISPWAAPLSPTLTTADSSLLLSASSSADTPPATMLEHTLCSSTLNTDCLSTPFVYALATCHSLSVVEGELIGDPTEILMQQASGWALTNGLSCLGQLQNEFKQQPITITSPPVMRAIPTVSISKNSANKDHCNTNNHSDTLYESPRVSEYSLNYSSTAGAQSSFLRRKPSLDTTDLDVHSDCSRQSRCFSGEHLLPSSSANNLNGCNTNSNGLLPTYIPQRGSVSHRQHRPSSSLTSETSVIGVWKATHGEAVNAELATAKAGDIARALHALYKTQGTLPLLARPTASGGALSALLRTGASLQNIGKGVLPHSTFSKVKSLPCVELGVVRRFTFESSLRRMCVIVRDPLTQHCMALCKGAPEEMIVRSSTDSLPRDLWRILREHTEQGKRVFGFAGKYLGVLSKNEVLEIRRDVVESRLQFLGLMVLVNRLKSDTPAAIHQLRNAGCMCIMATGDNCLTAVAVARGSGILLGRRFANETQLQGPLLLCDLKTLSAHDKVPLQWLEVRGFGSVVSAFEEPIPIKDLKHFLQRIDYRSATFSFTGKALAKLKSVHEILGFHWADVKEQMRLQALLTDLAGTNQSTAAAYAGAKKKTKDAAGKRCTFCSSNQCMLFAEQLECSVDGCICPLCGMLLPTSTQIRLSDAALLLATGSSKDVGTGSVTVSTISDESQGAASSRAKERSSSGPNRLTLQSIINDRACPLILTIEVDKSLDINKSGVGHDHSPFSSRLYPKAKCGRCSSHSYYGDDGNRYVDDNEYDIKAGVSNLLQHQPLITTDEESISLSIASAFAGNGAEKHCTDSPKLKKKWNLEELPPVVRTPVPVPYVVRMSLYEFVLRNTLVYSRMSPAEKQTLILALRNLPNSPWVAMCGDGANDCSAMKSADVGLAIGLSNASIAAAFVSSKSSIRCVVDVLREGRAGLINSFQLFKYIMMYSLMEFVAVSCLYYFGSNLTMNQYTWIDLIEVLPLSVLMSWTMASSRLVRRVPNGSLVSRPVFVSLIGQVFIATSTLVTAIYMLTKQSFYTPFAADEYTGLGRGEELACHENSVAFLMCQTHFIILALAVSSNRPWRRGVLSNHALTALITTLTFISASLLIIPPFVESDESTVVPIILWPVQWLHNLLNIVYLPVEFRVWMVSLVLAHFVSANLWEVVVVSPLSRQAEGAQWDCQAIKDIVVPSTVGMYDAKIRP